MQKLFLFLGLVVGLILLPGQVFALPVPANAEKLLNLGDVRGPGVQLGYQVISSKVQLLKCKYDYASAGGSSSAALNLKAVDGSNCQLPNKAVVKRVMIDVITAPTGADGATIALSTGQTAGDLYATHWTDSGLAAGIKEGIPTGTAALSIKMTAARSPTLTIARTPLNAGKFNVFIEYLLSD